MPVDMSQLMWLCSLIIIFHNLNSSIRESLNRSEWFIYSWYRLDVVSSVTYPGNRGCWRSVGRCRMSRLGYGLKIILKLFSIQSPGGGCNISQVWVRGETQHISHTEKGGEGHTAHLWNWGWGQWAEMWHLLDRGDERYGISCRGAASPWGVRDSKNISLLCNNSILCCYLVSICNISLEISEIPDFLDFWHHSMLWMILNNC